MKIAIFLSNYGGSPLQVSLERGLAELGHTVEPYQRGQGYDLILVLNQVSHVTNYEYPEFPDKDAKIAFIDSSEFGFFTRLPAVARDYANTFAVRSMAHDTKNRHEQTRLRDYLEGKSFPYFLREHNKLIDYPPEYHPIDYPLYGLSVCHEVPNREEYLARPMDLFVSWGLSHPWRKQLTKVMRALPIKSEILVLEENGTPRMPQAEFFARTRQAKCSVSFDGYGSSSFRLTEVLVRSLLLRGPLSIRCRADLEHGVTCVDYDVCNDGETFLSTNLGEKILESLADPERSYRIYERGYHWANEYLTERATAQYVLDVVAQHDWSRPTQLSV